MPKKMELLTAEGTRLSKVDGRRESVALSITSPTTKCPPLLLDAHCHGNSLCTTFLCNVLALEKEKETNEMLSRLRST